MNSQVNSDPPPRKRKRRRIKKIKISQGPPVMDRDNKPTASYYFTTFVCDDVITADDLENINYVDVRNTPIGDFPQLQKLINSEEANEFQMASLNMREIYLIISGLISKGVDTIPLSIYYNDGLDPVMETYLIDMEKEK